MSAVGLARLVKPLVWDTPCVANNHTHIARSAYGEYYVHIDGGRHQAWLEANTKPYENLIGPVVGSLYEAQGLADADHAARVLAALDADLLAELVGALLDIADPQRLTSQGDPTVLRDRARAAIAKVELTP